MKAPTYEKVARWATIYIAALVIAFFAFMAFVAIMGGGPYPEGVWFLPALALGLAFWVLAEMRPDLRKKRSPKDFVDGAVALFRDLWPLAAVAVGLWVGAILFRLTVGAILSLPVWAMVGLGSAVLALAWIGVGTAEMKRGGILAVAYLAMILPAVGLIWWLTSL